MEVKELIEHMKKQMADTGADYVKVTQKVAGEDLWFSYSLANFDENEQEEPLDDEEL